MRQLFIALLLSCGITTLSYGQYENMKIKVGQTAPELSSPNPAGETLQLTKIAKDHVVLLDFWASWCRPCRGANPKLVAIYNKYKDQKFKSAKKGFTIVSVSLDQNKDAWVKAINDDKLEWPFHMSDLGAWDSKNAEIYGVQFIPQAFLVGPDGKIIGMYNMAEEAEADLAKLAK